MDSRFDVDALKQLLPNGTKSKEVIAGLHVQIGKYRWEDELEQEEERNE